MTLIELHTACIKICNDADKSTHPSDLADAIAAIQLLEQESENPTVNNSLTVAKAKQEPVAYAVTVGSEMENNIGFFVDKEKAKECFEDASVGGYESLFKIINLYAAPPSVDALEKQVKELKTRLNQNVFLLVNETLQSENEILLKQVAELKESLRYAICEADEWYSVCNCEQTTIKTDEMKLARERAK